MARKVAADVALAMHCSGAIVSGGAKDAARLVRNYISRSLELLAEPEAKLE